MYFKKTINFLLIFKDKELMNYGAALSFYTMLSIIPILFVCFSVFTQIPSFDAYYDRLKNLIFAFLIPTQQELISSYLDTFLKNSLNLGIMGLIAMAFTSLALFSSYDFVINRITKSEPRGLWHSISAYWTLLTLVPLGLGLSFYISAYIQKTLDDFKIGLNFFAFLPFLIIWFLFLISFSSSMQKRTNKKYLLISSFASATVWYVCKNLFVYYVVYNKAYTNVYGSFSTLLFFLIWIYISWIIYLFGFKAYNHFSLEQYERQDIEKNKKKTQRSKTNAK